MAPIYNESDIGFILLSVLTSTAPSAIWGIVSYVLTSWGLYTLAQRREIGKPWLAWIPVANIWILGSLSDQYQYLVKGENKSKRKVLLALNILTAVITLVILVLFGVMVAGAILGGSENELLAAVMGPGIAMLGLCVPLMGVAIATMIIRYMAMYDIYRSTDPANSTLFLVLSILVNVTEPFFLFFSRNKDQGMPPRKQPEPVYVPTYDTSNTPGDYTYHDSNQDPWAPGDKNYL